MKSNGWIWRTGLVLAGVSLFILVSVWLYMPWWELALRSDKSPVSWLSSALLFAAAFVALKLGVHRQLPPLLCIWLTVALLALALDEQFAFHEYWRYHCSKWIVTCGSSDWDHLSWLGDAPMIGVGIVGLLTVAISYRAIETTASRGLMVAAICVGIFLALGIHFGSASGFVTPPLKRFEEVFEVLSESLFLCALLEIKVAAPAT